MKKYDIGLTGLWFAGDYGNAISYYMLCCAIRAEGRSVVMIAPEGWDEDGVVSGFADETYGKDCVSLSVGIEQVNDMCRAFAVGSGQVWNYEIAKSFEDLFYLQFVDNKHPRFSFSTSFGHTMDFVPPKVRSRIQADLGKFSQVYVREPHMRYFLDGTYGVVSEQMMDPLLWNPECLKDLGKKSILESIQGRSYILLHLLDNNEELAFHAQQFAERTGCRLLIMENKKPVAETDFMDVFGTMPKTDVTVHDYMRMLMGARYIITDSYSTSCISLALGKNIISLINRRRGSTRFSSLFHRLGVSYFLLEKASDLDGIQMNLRIDYRKVEAILQEERAVFQQQLEKTLRIASAAKRMKRRPKGKAWERQAKYYATITSRPIVLLGGGDSAIRFCGNFGELLDIRCVLTNYRSEIGREIDIGNGRILKISEYRKEKIQRNDFIIVCRGDIKNYYKDAKEWLEKDGFFYGTDFISMQLAETILNRKKIMTFVGYCQLDVMRDIFCRMEGIFNEYDLRYFRLETHTMKDSYRYSEYVEYVKLSDIFVYTALFSTHGKSDIEYLDFLPEDTKTCSLPRLAFRGLHPYKADNLETFHELTRYEGHVHWPFLYEEPIIDAMILKGESDEQIYGALMEENLIPVAEIQRNFDIACKAISISEKNTDIKMLDYIRKNYKERMLYRDCLHYQNCMYFEIARRINKKLGLYVGKEIDELEDKLQKEGKQFIDFTEVPILPCVAKALGIQYATEGKKYRVRNYNGSIREMTRKEWILSYCEYTRSIMSVKKFFEK